MSNLSFEECKHGSRSPKSLLQGLNDSQGGVGRHKCASCAYNRALSEAKKGVSTYGDMVTCPHNSVAPRAILNELPDNQGGSGRHKCVVCAYHLGHAHGRSVAPETAWNPRVDSKIGGQLQVNDIATLPPTVRNDDHLKLIGDIGESLVLDYEKGLLIDAKKTDLANKITHVAVEEGDAAGYDIRSFETDGTVKFIEVKTTEGDVDRPLFLTANELRFAEANADNYFIYRLFNLDIESRTAQFYVSTGNPKNFYLLSPTVYRMVRK